MGVPLRTKTAHPPGWADHMVGGAGGEGDEGHWLYPGSGQAPLRQGSGHVALGSFPHVSFLEGQDISGRFTTSNLQSTDVMLAEERRRGRAGASGQRSGGRAVEEGRG